MHYFVLRLVGDLVKLKRQRCIRVLHDCDRRKDLILNIERLRLHMTRISDALTDLLRIEELSVRGWARDDNSETSTNIQLKLDFGDELHL